MRLSGSFEEYLYYSISCGFHQSIGSLRGKVRKALAKELAEIDGLVKAILSLG